MRKFPIALTALFMFGGAAHAQCTPEGMARFNANGAQLDAVAARIKAGDCSLIPEWKRLFAVRHAIQHRSQLQTTPYTCRVDIKSPPVPHCGTETAKAAPTPTAPPSPLPVAPAQHEAAAPPPNNSQQKSANCSDIAGTGGGSPTPCVRVPGWTPTEPFNHSRTPVVVSTVQNRKVVELTIPGLSIGKFGLWLDDGVLSVQSWNNLPAPSHVDVDVNKCPGHNAWKGWTEPRCEELAQKEELSVAESSARADSMTSNRCQRQGGTIFNPNEGAITEEACLSVGGRVITPFDNESRGWCPATKGCWDGAKWTKIIEVTPVPPLQDEIRVP
jgi:hypothetical protein